MIEEKPLILVVDDEEVIRNLLETIIRRDGRFNIETASDGLAALDAISKRNFSLVITDLKMPNMAGIPLLRKLRQTHPDMPVLVFSGYGDMDDAIEALRLGALNFLRKPFDLDQILPVAERAINLVKRVQKRRLIYEYIDEMTTCMEIPPRLSEIEVVVQHLVDPLVPMGLVTPMEVKNIFLALDEVLTNSILYGSLGMDSSLRSGQEGHRLFEEEAHRRELDPLNQNRKVLIRCEYNRNQVLYRFKDPGNGFDYRSLPDPTLPENLMREHGRGLLLVQCFMDELKFNDSGNEVTVIKKRILI